LEGKKLAEVKFKEELWDEMPEIALMALGRRGMEKISLRECYNPKCANVDDSKLHPVKLEMEKTNAEGGAHYELKKYLIHCDECNSNFNLVFERHMGKSDESGDKNPKNIIIERVYATDESGDDVYGDIGFIQ
jgi:hypothetical protein